MSSRSAVHVILGDGPVAHSLAGILDCKLITRKADDTGWKWSEPRTRDTMGLLLVASGKASPAEVIRWHTDAWRCPGVRQLFCGLVGLSPDAVQVLAERDVFGRLDARGETFASWSSYIALAPLSEPLALLLERIAHLKPCPVATWERRARQASVIQPLLSAICRRNVTELQEILPKANLQDWDTVCFRHSEFGGHHAYAHHVRTWLSAVTSGVTPSWDEGESLFRPLASKP